MNNIAEAKQLQNSLMEPTPIYTLQIVGNCHGIRGREPKPGDWGGGGGGG